LDDDVVLDVSGAGHAMVGVCFLVAHPFPAVPVAERCFVDVSVEASPDDDFLGFCCALRVGAGPPVALEGHGSRMSVCSRYQPVVTALRGVTVQSAMWDEQVPVGHHAWWSEPISSHVQKWFVQRMISAMCPSRHP
jgi:hypothetical protein